MLGQRRFPQNLYYDESTTNRILGSTTENPAANHSYIKIILNGKVCFFGGFDANDNVILVPFCARKIDARFTGHKVREKILQKLGAKASVHVVPTTYDGR